MIVDLIIIGVIIAGAVIGRFRGLASALLNICSFILAIILSLMLYVPVENALIQNTKIDETIQSTIYSKVDISITNKENSENSDSKLPKVLQNYIDEAQKGAQSTADAVTLEVSKQITLKIMEVIAFIAVFVIVRLILIVIKFASKILTKLPVLKQIDHVGGLICGLVESIMLVYLAFAIISIVSPTIKNENVLKNINNSYIGSKMYNNNIILKKIY